MGMPYPMARKRAEPDRLPRIHAEERLRRIMMNELLHPELVGVLAKARKGFEEKQLEGGEGDHLKPLEKAGLIKADNGTWRVVAARKEFVRRVLEAQRLVRKQWAGDIASGIKKKNDVKFHTL